MSTGPGFGQGSPVISGEGGRTVRRADRTGRLPVREEV